jgi:hypothetical protein
MKGLTFIAYNVDALWVNQLVTLSYTH